ncbi:MAG: class I SAM-dependent methyltransferase [Saprospiraceae bacterium]|nr:class I SAM-dependent methyltransferase [Saprospiraceae bacterium]
MLINKWNRIIDKITWFLKYKKGLSSLSYFPISYIKDGLATIHNSGFINTPKFHEAYNSALTTNSWSEIEWRVHVILWAAMQGSTLDGDFIECGTNKGGFAKAICTYLNFKSLNKTFYLLDTFNGLVEKLLSKEEKDAGRQSGGYEECYGQVMQSFKEYKNVKIVRGTVPDTLDQVISVKFAFASIDMNCIGPEIAALDFIYPKLVKGGIIVLDDYAYKGYEEQYKAHNTWALNNGIEILSLPTGQGIILK